MCVYACRSKNEEDEFRNFRMESLFDAVLDVSEIVSPLKCLHALVPVLTQQLEACVSKGGAEWQPVEVHSYSNTPFVIF